MRLRWAGVALISSSVLASQWLRTSPGVISFLEWRTWLLITGLCVTFAAIFVRPFDRGE